MHVASYAEVTGLDAKPDPSDAIAHVVCTDMAVAGEFACSDECLNHLQEILLRTVRNYVVHIPNDPTREKAGWTQDIETGFFETAYNFSTASTYVKWQRDFLDAVHENGYMPPVVPGRFDGPTINGPWWGGALVYAPWYLYEFYGDEGILEESYPAMQRYLAWLGTQAEEHIVRRGLGDWLEVGSPDARPRRTPVALTSTAAYHWFARILDRTAHLLGRSDEAAQYAAIADEIRAAYNREFFSPDTGDYATGSQTALLVSLLFDLVPREKRDLVLHRLVQRIADDKSHLSTGFVGTPLLLTGLVELGSPELAWAIATQTDYPSFIDAVLNRGNTVMKETWEGGLVQMPSLQGPIGTWFYHSLAGIRPDPSAPGFKKIILRPETAGDLAWVRAHHDSPYGRIASAWRRTGNRLTLEVSLPPNTQATVYLPARAPEGSTEGGRPLSEAEGVQFLRMEGGRAVLQVGSGDYRFESVMP
ncbi:MAG: alpha-L-rhamnosidase C-terminal domain-containing protein [Planctomycetota bacterium]